MPFAFLEPMMRLGFIFSFLLFLAACGQSPSMLQDLEASKLDLEGLYELRSVNGLDIGSGQLELVQEEAMAPIDWTSVSLKAQVFEQDSEARLVPLQSSHSSMVLADSPEAYILTAIEARALVELTSTGFLALIEADGQEIILEFQRQD